MPPELFVVQWAHVLSGILWLAAFIGLLVASRLGLRIADDSGPSVERSRTRYLQFVGIMAAITLVSGVLRATIWGPLRAVDVLGTPYGVIWVASMALTLGLLVHERWVAPELLSTGTTASGRTHVLLHAAGFSGLISAMVLLRFGL